MQTTFLISSLALATSAVGLAVSIRNSSFARRTKLTEMRLTILAKLSESSIVNKRLQRLHKEFRDLVIKNGETSLADSLDVPELAENQSDLDDLYVKIARMPAGAAMHVYESEFHRVSRVCDTILSFEEGMRNKKDEYERSLQKHV